MLFEFIIFRFDLVLFKYYFLFELFYFNCKLLYFRIEYLKIQSWSKRKRIRSWFGMKIRNIGQKYVTPKARDMAWPVPPMARPVPPMARPCHPSKPSLAAFAFETSYLLAYFWPKSPWFLVEHSIVIFLRA